MASAVPAIEPAVGRGEARSRTQNRCGDRDDKSSREEGGAGQLQVGWHLAQRMHENRNGGR